MTCISRPMPESLSSSWTSRSLQWLPLMAYSEPPLRNMVRLIVTSAYSIGREPSVLSMVSWTSARPSGGRPDVPAKMTSSILPPRSDLAPCSPITHVSASTSLDLPDLLGPTMQVMPGSSCSVVEEAKDLKPLSVRLLRYNVCSPCVAGVPAVQSVSRCWTRHPASPPRGCSGRSQSGLRADLGAATGKGQRPDPTQRHGPRRGGVPGGAGRGSLRRRRRLLGRHLGRLLGRLLGHELLVGVRDVCQLPPDQDQDQR